MGDGVPRSSSARLTDAAASDLGRKKGASGGGLSSTIKSKKFYQVASGKAIQEVRKGRGGRFRRADARSRQTPGRGSLD